ncbi:hypothetical protein ScPMuIL_008340 [Solemya velum]
MKTTSRPKKIVHVSSPQISQFDLQDTELVTQWRLLGVLVVSVLVITAIAVSIKPEGIQYESYEAELVWNLHTTPYVFDYNSEMQIREDNLEIYGHPNNMWTVDRRSDLSLQEFWDLYDAKWPVIVTDVVPQWPALTGQRILPAEVW